MNDPFLSLIGLARRANRLGIGHDAALSAVLSGRAQICLLASDASERLEREFTRASTDKNIKILRLQYSMAEIAGGIGTKAGVFTINDGGFAKKAAELLTTTSIKEDDSHDD